jgi:hypothetical protein
LEQKKGLLTQTTSAVAYLPLHLVVPASQVEAIIAEQKDRLEHDKAFSTGEKEKLKAQLAYDTNSDAFPVIELAAYPGLIPSDSTLLPPFLMTMFMLELPNVQSCPYLGRDTSPLSMVSCNRSPTD